MRTQRPTLALLTLLFLFNLNLNSISAINQPDPTTTNGSDFIRTSCNTTLYPDICYHSLNRYSSAIQQNPAQLARIAIAISLNKAKRMAAYVNNVSREAEYGAGEDPRAASAVHDCFSNFGDAVDEIRGSLKQMRHINSGESFRFQMSNVQTWMSAALTDEETCTDGFQDVADGDLKSEICDRATVVKKHTSNALALVNSYVEKTVP